MKSDGSANRIHKPERSISRPHYLGNTSDRSYSLLCNAVKEGGADLVTIAEIVEADHALQRHVLSLANSATFALRHRVDSVRQAVALLGAKRLRQFLGVSPGPDASGAVADFSRTPDPAA